RHSIHCGTTLDRSARAVTTPSAPTTPATRVNAGNVQKALEHIVAGGDCRATAATLNNASAPRTSGSGRNGCGERARALTAISPIPVTITQ
ncbi:MAG: hypothetical protein WAM44_01520, partial [Chthoniobacterales bacterium]